MTRRPASSATAPASRLPTPPAGPIPDALRNFDALPDVANVRLPVVCALFGISAPTAWRWVKKCKLPAGRKLSEGVTAWNVGQLRKALNGEAWQ